MLSSTVGHSVNEIKGWQKAYLSEATGLTLSHQTKFAELLANAQPLGIHAIGYGPIGAPMIVHRNTIKVYVLPGSNVQALPQKVGNRLVEFIYTEPAKFTLKVGDKINGIADGTLGCVVKKLADNQRYLLSNCHVL